MHVFILSCWKKFPLAVLSSSVWDSCICIQLLNIPIEIWDRNCQKSTCNITPSATVSCNTGTIVSHNCANSINLQFTPEFKLHNEHYISQVFKLVAPHCGARCHWMTATRMTSNGISGINLTEVSSGLQGVYP